MMHSVLLGFLYERLHVQRVLGANPWQHRVFHLLRSIIWRTLLDPVRMGV